MKTTIRKEMFSHRNKCKGEFSQNTENHMLNVLKLQSKEEMVDITTVKDELNLKSNHNT